MRQFRALARLMCCASVAMCALVDFATGQVACAASAELSVISSPPPGMPTTTRLEARATLSPGGRALSDDGEYMVFSSSASNLPGSVSDIDQVYLFTASTGAVELVSPGLRGGTAAPNSRNAVISGDGLVIAYTATFGDPEENLTQVQLTNRLTGATESLNMQLGLASDSLVTGSPALNQDGRYVAFTANAADLETGGTNAVTDVFVLDRQTSEVTRISAPSQSDQQPRSVAISNDGEVVSFATDSALVVEDTNGTTDVYLHLRSSGELQLLDLEPAETDAAPSSVSTIVMSDNGQFFAFVDTTPLEVQGVQVPSKRVFRHDRLSRTNLEAAAIGSEAISIEQAVTGFTTPTISADGRFVGFLSSTVDGGAGIRDFEQDTLMLPFEDSEFLPGHGRTLANVTLSADGSAIVFSTELEFSGNLSLDGLLTYHQRLESTEPTILEGAAIEVATADNESTTSKNGNSVSSDGRFVVFASRAVGYSHTNAYEQHIVLADTLTGTRLLLTAGQSQAEGEVISDAAAISASGSHVAFESTATSFTNMTEIADDDGGLSDVFVYELATGQITQASKPNPAFVVQSSAFVNPDLSVDGQFLVFNSSRTNSSGASGTSGAERVYRLDRTTADVLLISKTLDDEPNDGRADRARISADGATIVFVAQSPLLLGQPGNQPRQTVFIWEQDTDRAEQVSLAAPTQFFGDPVALSGNGRFIAYPIRSLQGSEQFAELLLHDLMTDVSQVLERFGPPLQCSAVSIQQAVLSHDGRYAGYRVLGPCAGLSGFFPPPTSLFRFDRFTDTKQPSDKWRWKYYSFYNCGRAGQP